MATPSSEILIVNYNTKRLLRNCLDSIFNSNINSLPRITVIDNNSSDDSVEMIKENFKTVHIIKNETNLGYGGALNQAIRKSIADVIFLCNSDLYFHKDTIENCLKFYEQTNNVGMLGAQLEYPNGDWQKSYFDLPSARSALKNILLIPNINNLLQRRRWDKNKYKTQAIKVERLNGAFMVAHGNTLRDMNGFDDDYFFYSEDEDLCRRVTIAGKDVIFNPNILITHIQGASSENHEINLDNISLLIKGKLIYYRKHLSNTETRIVLLGEYFNALTMSIITKILSLSNKRYVSSTRYFSAYFRELFKADKNAHPS